MDTSFMSTIFMIFLILGKHIRKINSKVTLKVDYYPNNQALIKCVVEYSQNITELNLYLYCPMNVQGYDICYNMCTSMCATPTCSSVIKKCNIDVQPTVVSVSFNINITEMKASGKWRCVYKNHQSFPTVLRKSLPKIIATSRSIVSPKVTGSSITPYFSRNSSISNINSSPKPAASLSSPDSNNGLVKLISTVPEPNSHSISSRDSVTLTTYLEDFSILQYMTRPELVLILIITLGCSLLLNLCFLIRCVLLKSVLENISRGIINSRCLLNCLCLDKVTIATLERYQPHSSPFNHHNHQLPPTHPHHHHHHNECLQGLLTTSTMNDTQHSNGSMKGGYLIHPHHHHHQTNQQQLQMLLLNNNNNNNSNHHSNGSNSYQMSHSFSAGVGDFYRCQPPLTPQNADNLQIYDDLSGVFNGSGTPLTLMGNDSHNNTLNNKQPNRSASLTTHDIQDDDNARMIRSQSNSNTNGTTNMGYCGSYSHNHGGPVGSVSSSLSSRYQNNNITPGSVTLQQQQVGHTASYYYHPGIGNYVVVSENPLLDSNQYTIGTSPPVGTCNNSLQMVQVVAGSGGGTSSPPISVEERSANQVMVGMRTSNTMNSTSNVNSAPVSMTGQGTEESEDNNSVVSGVQSSTNEELPPLPHQQSSTLHLPPPMYQPPPGINQQPFIFTQNTKINGYIPTNSVVATASSSSSTNDQPILPPPPTTTQSLTSLSNQNSTIHNSNHPIDDENKHPLLLECNPDISHNS